MKELIRDRHLTKYGIEGKVYFSLFNRYIDFHSEEDISEAYELKCAQYLNSLSEEIVTHLCLASIAYCNDFLDHIGEPLKEFKQPREVLALIEPLTLLIPNPEGSEEPVIHLELNCEWEEEHGMEWVVRGNRVLYVDAFNGVDPWDDFAEEEYNYVQQNT